MENIQKPINNFDEFCVAVEHNAWNTETIFKTVGDWTEDDGQALFFKLDSGEPPEVTCPLTVGFDFEYFTHWLPMPNEFGRGYRMACIKSGIKTSFNEPSVSVDSPQEANNWRDEGKMVMEDQAHDKSWVETAFTGKKINSSAVFIDIPDLAKC